jgi:hypothetical protein
MNASGKMRFGGGIDPRIAFPFARSLAQATLAVVTLGWFCQQWRGERLRPIAAGVAGWRFPPRRRCP